MKNSSLILVCLLAGLFSLSSFNLADGPTNVLEGVWIRKTDHLRIRINEVNDQTLESFILAEGDEKFPCDVTALPIYKNIMKVGRNLWTCDFLVVTMRNCSTDYEEGIIQVLKNGDLEITCPGYEKKIYSKSNPRYDTDKK
jgi:hypothetical protein